MSLVPFEEVKQLAEAVQNGVAVQVIMDIDDMDPADQRSYCAMLGFTGKETMKFCTILSEIKNMPGHYVVVGKRNEIVAGLHGDIFYVDKDDAEEWGE